jgi:hypothetical protein
VGQDGWEQWANEPSPAVIVEAMVRHWKRPIGVFHEIMDKVDQAVETSTPDEPVYATCVRVYEDWKTTRSHDAFVVLGMLQDVSLYAEHRYGDEIPRDRGLSMSRPIRSFFWLVYS